MDRYSMRIWLIRILYRFLISPVSQSCCILFWVYAEQTCGFGFVAVGLLQSGDDALALRVLVVQLQDVVGAYLSHRQRQFGGGDLRAAREQHRTLHHVVQFAEVAGP